MAADPAVPTLGAGVPGAEASGEEAMWASAAAYDRFMGRWSEQIAGRFLAALSVRAGRSWLDVGCGVGGLTAAVVERCTPSTVVGVDPAATFLDHARARLASARHVRFQQASMEGLPFEDAAFDATVSGLVLNFLPDPVAGMREMLRVTRAGGTVAAYVWDYDAADFFLARFWRAVEDVDGRPAPADERGRWWLCTREGLAELAVRSGLHDASIWTIGIDTPFPSADRLWDGFLLGVGPSGSWARRLPPDRLEVLRTRFMADLPDAVDGAVHLSARALAIAGRRRGDRAP